MNTSSDAARPRRTILGIWQLLPSPMISRYLAQQGWEWIFLDLQHGSLDSCTTYECIHTIRAAGARPFVRVPIGSWNDVSKYLDLGAQGIVVPMVNSAAEARRMARAAKYPPLGERSIGGDARYHYGEDYPERANQETLLLVQIEHLRAVKAAKAILSVEGVDGCFVGPTDLALSMGLPRRDFKNHPRHRAAIQHTVDVCLRLKKIACCNTSSIEDARAKSRQGFRCVTLESDVTLFMSCAEKLLKDLRRAVA
jgi:4-hydroxy-2-oxoheptanedioate aldolase